MFLIVAQALYRKYRSKSLGDVVGQDHITTALANALKNNQISHAYLLTGPRGVGKTSVARILAHEINQLPYNDETNHIDIIEIDAASNRRIDEIRDLRNKVHLAPTSAKYKVYIIDEVHMLTKEAFNALLKTLEEPPEHVIFILATTELHKLPPTIISRTQRYGFKPITNQKMVPHLKHIAEQEKIDIDNEALELIAEHANGGFRDAISLLDQTRHIADKISRQQVEDAIGLPPISQIHEIVQNIINDDAQSAYLLLTSLYDQGYNTAIIANQLIESGRKLLITNPSERLLQFLNEILVSENSSNQKIAIELAILKNYQFVGNPPVVQTPITKQTIEQIRKKPTRSPKPEKPMISHQNKPTDIKPTATVIKNDLDIQGLWQQVLASLKGNYNTLYGILNNAEVAINETDNAIEIGFLYPFHMKKASEAQNQELISQQINNLTGQNFKLSFIKTTRKPKKPAEPRKESDNLQDVDKVLSVFGGGEII